MNVGNGSETAQFYFWEYINPIFFAVYSQLLLSLVLEEPSSFIWRAGSLLYGTPFRLSAYISIHLNCKYECLAKSLTRAAATFPPAKLLYKLPFTT